MDSKPIRVYYAYTLYHLLLSLGDSLTRDASQKSTLIVNALFPESERLIQALNSWDESPFEEIIYLGSIEHLQGNERRNFKKNQVAFFTQYCESHNIAEASVFNDRTTDAQAFMHATRKYNPTTCIRYLENGGYAYCQRVQRKRSAPERLSNKFKYGKWWTDVLVQGTSPWIDEIWVQHPELCRSEYRAKGTYQLAQFSTIQPQLSDLLSVLAPLWNLDVDVLASGVDVVLMPYLENYASDDHKENCKLFIQQCTAQQLSIAVKYHPRESSADYLNVAGSPMVEILPSSLPIEVLMIGWGTNLKAIVGGASTAMISARSLLPEVQALCITADTPVETSIFEAFNALGVVLCENFDKVSQKLTTENTAR